MVLAIWDGYCLQVEETWRQVLDLVVAMVLERMAEVLGLDLDVWRLVDLEMLGALVQRVLEYLGLLRGLAWVLLLGVVALGLVFLLGLVAQGFHCLLVLGYFLVLVLEFLLRCWIRIVRILRPVLGLESVLGLEFALELAVGLPSSLERQAWASLMVLVQRQGL